MSKPDFGHLCLETGTQDISKWFDYMYPRVEALSTALYHTRHSWGQCPFCEEDYPLSMSSHITGKKHLKQLQQRLNYREPGSQSELDEYTQVWRLQFGFGDEEPYYFFNHLIGRHGFGKGDIGRISNGAGSAPTVSISRFGAPQYAAIHETRRPTADALSRPATDGRPDFGHLCLDSRERTRWEAYIRSYAEKLMDTLYKTRRSWGYCLVCDKEFPSNLATHIMGTAHLECLQIKLNHREPRTPADMEKFTQVWDLEYGFGEEQPQYFFNHINGVQGFGFGPAGAAPRDNAGEGSSSASHPTPVAMLPRLASPTSRPPQGLPRRLPTHSVSPPATRDYSSDEPRGNCRRLDYEKGLQNQATWYAFMDVPSKRLQENLIEATGKWQFRCAACQEDMYYGAHEHMVSKSHFQAMWNQFDKRWPQWDTAVGLQDQPWVSRFDTPGGVYLFNMLTGEQGFENDVRTVPTEDTPPSSQPVGPAAEHLQLGSTLCGGAQRSFETTSSARARASRPALSAPVAQPYQYQASSREGNVSYQQAFPGTEDRDKPCDVEKWRHHMEEKAWALEGLILQEAGSQNIRCKVCGPQIHASIASHLLSVEHMMSLWRRVGRQPPPPEVAHDWKRQWVQDIRTRDGTLYFNHITGVNKVESDV